MKTFLETWCDVAGYEGIYQVSNLGNVRSLNYHRTGQVITLKPVKNRDGYLQVALCKDSKMKSYLVHRLVAEAFIPNPDNLPEINHIDENKENNKVCSGMVNLEWCDHKQNCNHGTRIERMSEALSKKPIQLTLDGVFVKEWSSTKECGRNGFCPTNIAACCRGERKTHKGYRWMYAEDYYGQFA